MMRRTSLVSLFALSLAACTDSTLLHSYKPLPKDGWDRCDTICFDLPKAEADIDGTLYIGLRTTANPAYQDIVLAVEQYDEIEGFSRCDTVRYPLTDAEGFALTEKGYALSPGVNLHQYESQHVPIRLRKGKSCSVRIHHLMRHEVIPDITELGIRLDK